MTITTTAAKDANLLLLFCFASLIFIIGRWVDLLGPHHSVGFCVVCCFIITTHFWCGVCVFVGSF